MPTVSRLANRGLLGVYVDLVHARQELEGLLGRRGLGRRLAEVVGLIQVLRRSRPHELILDGRLPPSLGNGPPEESGGGS